MVIFVSLQNKNLCPDQFS